MAALIFLNIVNMNRNVIQEQRMKGYFIEAAKEILKGEGLKAASVRNIAERAGYSYATMYNYFKDVKDLIFLCVQDFQAECEEFIREEVKDVKPGRDRIKAIVKHYVRYFTQYPGIFDLFFVEKMPDIRNNKAAAELIYSFLFKLCKKDWEYCLQKKTFTKNEIILKHRQINFITAGLLIFYLNRMQPLEHKDFFNNIEEQMAILLL